MKIAADIVAVVSTSLIFTDDSRIIFDRDDKQVGDLVGAAERFRRWLSHDNREPAV